MKHVAVLPFVRKAAYRYKEARRYVKLLTGK
jgi:hypothetical protein